MQGITAMKPGQYEPRNADEFGTVFSKYLRRVEKTQGPSGLLRPRKTPGSLKRHLGMTVQKGTQNDPSSSVLAHSLKPVGSQIRAVFEGLFRRGAVPSPSRLRPLKGSCVIRCASVRDGHGGSGGFSFASLIRLRRENCGPGFAGPHKIRQGEKTNLKEYLQSIHKGSVKPLLLERQHNFFVAGPCRPARNRLFSSLARRNTDSPQPGSHALVSGRAFSASSASMARRFPSAV